MPLKDYTADQLLLCQQLKRKLYLGRITLPAFWQQLLTVGFWPERIPLETHEVMAAGLPDTVAQVRARFKELAEERDEAC